MNVTVWDLTKRILKMEPNIVAKKIYQDHEGHTSMLRIVWALCAVAMITTWCTVSILAKELQSFGMGDAVLIVGMFGGKVAQKWIEINKKQ